MKQLKFGVGTNDVPGSTGKKYYRDWGQHA